MASRLFLLLFVLALSSCSVSEDAPISLFDLAGNELRLSFKDGKPDGGGLAIDEKSPSLGFLLEKQLVPPASTMLAITVATEAPGSVLEFSIGSSESKAKRVAAFSSFEGEGTYCLSFSPDTAFRYIGVSARLGSGQKAFVKAMRLVPFFRGFEQEAGAGSRVSDRISLQAMDGGSQVWRFSPTPGLSGFGDTTWIKLRYSSRVDKDLVIGRGSAKAKLRMSNPGIETWIPVAAFGKGEGGDFTFDIPSDAKIDTLALKSEGYPNLPKVDPGVLLLSSNTELQGDFSVFVWDTHPEVLLFDFLDYDTQDRYLKRLAFFVEKKGFAGRLASDAEIAALHGWNAHDYKAEDLAKFFSLAAEKDFPLNSQELELRGLLLDSGVLHRKAGGFAAGKGALISITRESPPYLRHLFLTHELSHALFFVDKEYRDFCSALWKSMPTEERWFYILYFGWMNYDTSSSPLMAAELQAYLAQQPTASATEYFTKTLPARLVENHPELVDPIAVYMSTFGGNFKLRAEEIDAWLRKKYGFGAGTAFLLR